MKLRTKDFRQKPTNFTAWFEKFTCDATEIMKKPQVIGIRWSARFGNQL
jgi:hypothetical protein